MKLTSLIFLLRGEAELKTNMIHEVLNMYVTTTKVSCICIDYSHINPPLFSIGLSHSSILEFADFEEVLIFLLSKIDPNGLPFLFDSNMFHTYQTRNAFIYNIVFIKNSLEDAYALVAGPVLTSFPSKRSIGGMLKHQNLSMSKKNEFVDFLNTVPLIAYDHIYQFGKLLLMLLKSGTGDWYLSVQDFQGKRLHSDNLFHQETLSSFSINQEANKLHEYYRFNGILMDRISHGNTGSIDDLMNEFASLFQLSNSSKNHLRFFKDKCILISAIACNYAIQSNVPYDRMYNSLWRYIQKLEELNDAELIHQHLKETLTGYAKAVFSLSGKEYSIHINRVMQYIKIHFSEKLTLKQLADYIHVSPVYLSSIIKKETNMSLSNLINLVRIEESKRLLVFTNKSMHEIACQVGYNYQTHFNNVFQKYEGIAPLEYRRIHGSKNDLLTI